MRLLSSEEQRTGNRARVRPPGTVTTVLARFTSRHLDPCATTGRLLSLVIRGARRGGSHRWRRVQGDKVTEPC
jgi:hypothetical protein